MGCRLVILAILASATLFAEGGFEGGKPSHALLATGSNRVSIINSDGSKIVRVWKTRNNADAWMLPSGNILVADGSAWEATPEGIVIWRYKPTDQSGGGLFSCQRLANGNTLIGENSTGLVFELTPKGEKLGQIQVPLNPNRHQTMRMVRRLENGNTLVCRSGFNTVTEYDAQGTVVWEQKVPSLAFAAVRDAEGNTYISSLDQIQKYAPDHRILWEFKASESGLPIRNMTGFQLLPNGNLIVGDYSYFDGKGNGVGIFEVTPEKKVLWQYSCPYKSDRSHMAVQLLDPEITTVLR
ncbi:MAG: hypothetical protein RSB14_04305 [Kiritimatiellia bacterium]